MCPDSFMEDDLDFGSSFQTLSAVPQLTGTVTHSTDRSADKSESADRSLTPPTEYSDAESNFDCEDAVFCINLKEEENKFDDWYKTINEWLEPEEQEDGKPLNRMEPEEQEDCKLLNWMEPE